MSLCLPCAKRVARCCSDCLRQLPDSLVVEPLTTLAAKAWRHCFLKRPLCDSSTMEARRQGRGWYEMRWAVEHAYHLHDAVVAANGGTAPAVVLKQREQTEIKLAAWKLQGYTW